MAKLADLLLHIQTTQQVWKVMGASQLLVSLATIPQRGKGTACKDYQSRVPVDMEEVQYVLHNVYCMFKHHFLNH